MRYHPIGEMEDTTIKEKPNTTNKNKRLCVDVSIKDIEIFENLVSLFARIITDERIDKEIRQSYLDEFISNI